MSEPSDTYDRAPAGWSAARGFGLIAGVNLVVGLGLLLPSRDALAGVVDAGLVLFPLLSLGWNAMLCLFVRRKGGSRALRGAVTGTALVFLASSSCWVYEADGWSEPSSRPTQR